MLTRLGACAVWDFTPKSLASALPLPSMRPFAQIKHNCQTVRGAPHLVPRPRILTRAAAGEVADNPQSAMDAERGRVSALHGTPRPARSFRGAAADGGRLTARQIGNMDHSLDVFSCKVRAHTRSARPCACLTYVLNVRAAQGDVIARLSDRQK